MNIFQVSRGRHTIHNDEINSVDAVTMRTTSTHAFTHRLRDFRRACPQRSHCDKRPVLGCNRNHLAHDSWAGNTRLNNSRRGSKLNKKTNRSNRWINNERGVASRPSDGGVSWRHTKHTQRRAGIFTAPPEARGRTDRICPCHSAVIREDTHVLAPAPVRHKRRNCRR